MTLSSIRRRLARPPRRLRAAGARQAAVALVLLPGRRGLEALLIRRARHPRDPWSGQVGLPGGRRDPGDRSLLGTAVREAVEELGLDLGREGLLGELDDVHPRTPALPPLVIRPFVFLLEERPRLVPSAEVAYPLWVRLDDLAPGRARPAARGRRLSVPCLRAGRLMVWGLTRRILTELLAPAT